MLLKRSLESIDGRRFVAKILARRTLVRPRGLGVRAGGPVHSRKTGQTHPFPISFGAFEGKRTFFWFACALERCGAAEPSCDEAVC